MQAATKLKEEANALFTSSNLSEAVRTYDLALNAVSEDFSQEAKQLKCICESNKAQCYLQMKDHKSALTAASKAIEFDPKHVKSYFRRGSAHEHLGEKREALLDYWRAHTLDENSVNILIALYRVTLRYDGPVDLGILRVARARAWLSEGTRLASEQRMDESIPFFVKYILSGYQQACAEPDPQLIADVVLYALRKQTGVAGKILYAFFLSGAKPEEAEEELCKVLDTPQDQPVSGLTDLYIIRGFIRGMVNRPEPALKDFDEAIALEPNNTRALYLRGKTLRFMKRTDDAIRDMVAAVDQLPDDEFGLPDMIFEMCGMMLQQGWPVEAVEARFMRGVTAEQVHAREYGPAPKPWQYRSQVLKMLAIKKGHPLPPGRAGPPEAEAAVAAAQKSPESE